MTKRLLVLGAAVVTIVAWAPAVAVVLAYVVSGLTGCRIDEASVHPCQVGPVDIGGLLYLMGMSGWYFLATWPVAFLAILFWTVYLVVALGQRVRRRENS